MTALLVDPLLCTFERLYLKSNNNQTIVYFYLSFFNKAFLVFPSFRFLFLLLPSSTGIGCSICSMGFIFSVWKNYAMGSTKHTKIMLLERISKCQRFKEATSYILLQRHYRIQLTRSLILTSILKLKIK